MSERAAAQRAERIQPEAEAAPALASVVESERPSQEGYIEVEAAAPTSGPASSPEPALGRRPDAGGIVRPGPRRGRLSRAMSLFGQAFGTLFGGGDA